MCVAGLLAQLNLSENALAASECGLKVLIGQEDIQGQKWVRTCDSTNYEESTGGIYYIGTYGTGNPFNWGLIPLMDGAGIYLNFRKNSNDARLKARAGKLFEKYPYMEERYGNRAFRLPQRFVKRACPGDSTKMCFTSIGAYRPDQDAKDEASDGKIYWLLLSRDEGLRPVSGTDRFTITDNNGNEFEYDGRRGSNNPVGKRFSGNHSAWFPVDDFSNSFIEAPEGFEPLAGLTNVVDISSPYGVLEQEFVIDGITVKPLAPDVSDPDNPTAVEDDAHGLNPVAQAVTINAGFGYPWSIPFTLTVKGGAVIRGGAIAADGQVFPQRAINLKNLDSASHSGDLTVDLVDGTVLGGTVVESNRGPGKAVVKLRDGARIESFNALTAASPGSSVTPGTITISGDNSSGIVAGMSAGWGSARINTPLAIRTTGDGSHGVRLSFASEDILTSLLRKYSERTGNSVTTTTLGKLLDLAVGDGNASDATKIGALTRASILEALGADGGTPNSRVRYWVRTLNPDTGQQTIDAAIEFLKSGAITDEILEGGKQAYIAYLERGDFFRGSGILVRFFGEHATASGEVIVSGNPGMAMSRDQVDGITVNQRAGHRTLGPIWIGREGDFAGDAKSEEVDFDGDGVVDARVYRSKLIVDEQIETTGTGSHGVLVEISDGRAFDIVVDADISAIGEGSDAVQLKAASGNEFRATGAVSVAVGEDVVVSAAGADADGIRILGDGSKTVRVDGAVTGGSGTGAGIHLEGGGTVIVGTSGRVSADSGVALLANDPGDLVIVLIVPDLDDPEALRQALLDLSTRIAGEIRNAVGQTSISIQDVEEKTIPLVEDGRTVATLSMGGLYDFGFGARDGALQATVDFVPRAFVYEALPQVLLDLNRVPSLRERAGGQWNGPTWARLQVGHGSHEPDGSTTGADYDWNTWRFDAGMEGLLRKGEDGSRWLAGVSVHYGVASADISGRPVFGSDTDKGDLNVRGFGMGASTTWRRADGFYLDGQATVSRYDIDLSSARHGLLREDVDAHVFGLGLEIGRQMELWDGVTLTPHAQLAWSRIDLDSFTDSLGSRVSLDQDDSLQGRVGLSVEDRSILGNSDVHIHGTLLLEQEFEDETVVKVSGERLVMEAEPTRVVMEAGATYDWGDGEVVLYGQGRAAVRVGGDGNGQEFGGTVGLKARF